MPGWFRTLLWIGILVIGAQALHIDIPAVVTSAAQDIGVILKSIKHAL